MRNLRTKFILETIEKIGDFSIDVLDLIITSHPRHYKKMKRQMIYGPFYKELFERPKGLSYEEYKKLETQKFYNLLSYLKKQGLVKKSKKEGRKSLWEIAEKGRKKLKMLNEKIVSKLPLKFYKKENDGKLKIIIFDIPEEESKKRRWLRINLIELGFSKLQKSVWAGKNKIPEDFINDLKELNIFQYLEIFSVDQVGTIGKEK